MLRRLYHEQPDSFAFTPGNQKWAEAQITKYPHGREASAIIPLLWRAQEQEGWLTRPAIEHIADMLGMAYIRALEVASFYFMFQLKPVGSLAHFQICGTTSCMICGAEDLVAVCKERISPRPLEVSPDGKFSWEEVECLGACANAPMAQIGKDYYEDLTAERFSEIIDEIAAGKVPTPGPQNGRYASEPLSGLTTLKEFDSGHTQYNAAVQLAKDLNDTIRRIDGTEVPVIAPWGDQGGRPVATEPRSEASEPAANAPTPQPEELNPAPATQTQVDESASERAMAEPEPKPETPAAPDTREEPARENPTAAGAQQKPKALDAARHGTPDDLKKIKGVGPKLERQLNAMGFFHFDQIADWTAEEVAWVDENLEGFRGRVSRDNWVEQASRLARGEETEFSQRARKEGKQKD